MSCVVITRGGEGDAWLFDSIKDAVLSPIPQLGDAYCDSSDAIIANFKDSEFEGLARKAGDPSLERAIQSTKTFSKDDRRSFSLRLWDQLRKTASRPPVSPDEIVSVIRKDRELSLKKSNVYRPDPGQFNLTQEHSDMSNEKANGNKTTRTRISKDATIKFGQDKEGVSYGPDNNPKRPGSAANARFALYENGQTVQQALDAGITSGDINWDAKQGFIILENA